MHGAWQPAEVAHLHTGSKVYASLVLLLKCDVGWLLVQPDAKALQLMLYELCVHKVWQPHVKCYDVLEHANVCVYGAR